MQLFSRYITVPASPSRLGDRDLMMDASWSRYTSSRSRLCMGEASWRGRNQAWCHWHWQHVTHHQYRIKNIFPSETRNEVNHQHVRSFPSCTGTPRMHWHSQHALRNGCTVGQYFADVLCKVKRKFIEPRDKPIYLIGQRVLGLIIGRIKSHISTTPPNKSDGFFRGWGSIYKL